MPLPLLSTCVVTTLYNVVYEDGDSEDLSKWEYNLACQLSEQTEKEDDVHEVNTQSNSDSEGSSAYDLKEKMQRQKKKAKKRKTSKQKRVTKNIKASDKSIQEKTSLLVDTTDVQLLGGKKTLSGTTWGSLSNKQQSDFCKEIQNPLKTNKDEKESTMKMKLTKRSKKDTQS